MDNEQKIDNYDYNYGYKEIAETLNELNPEQLQIMIGWLLEAGEKKGR